VSARRLLSRFGLVWLLSGCQLISGLNQLEVRDAASPDASPQFDAGSCSAVATECDLVSQCGCAVGEHCQYRSAAPHCYIAGTTPIGATCSSNDACAAGSGCLDGLCKKYCADDDDCGDGQCLSTSENGKPLASVKACLTRCDFITQEPCAAGSQCAQLNSRAPEQFGVEGAFCFVPMSVCTTDQRCDEPAWGTRACSAGSDAADCSCSSSVPGANCDVTKQCGCSPGTHCALAEVRGAQAGLTCAPDRPQPKQRGELCNDELECAAGYSCWRGLCEKYCSGDADCTAGHCIAINNPGEVSGVRVCTINCNFDAPSECAKGSTCVHAPGALDYCFIPRSPCPYAGDGVCDESKGTRICLDGTDAKDCR
jgi:hypothetical protein